MCEHFICPTMECYTKEESDLLWFRIHDIEDDDYELKGHIYYFVGSDGQKYLMNLAQTLEVLSTLISWKFQRVNLSLVNYEEKVIDPNDYISEDEFVKAKNIFLANFSEELLLNPFVDKVYNHLNYIFNYSGVYRTCDMKCIIIS